MNYILALNLVRFSSNYQSSNLWKCVLVEHGQPLTTCCGIWSFVCFFIQATLHYILQCRRRFLPVLVDLSWSITFSILTINRSHVSLYICKGSFSIPHLPEHYAEAVDIGLAIIKP